MKTVMFLGPLREKFPNGIQVAGESAADCIALLQNYPEFSPGQELIRVRLPGFQSRDALYQATDKEVIELEQIDAPEDQFAGAGQKVMGVIQIVIGIIMIYASWGTASAQGYAMMAAGFGMVLGGIMALMMKAPEKPKNETENKSNYLAANKNTVKIGTTIPYLFGRRKVWGHLLSFNVTATNLNVGGKPYCPHEGVLGVACTVTYGGNYGGGYGYPGGAIGGGSNITYEGSWETYNEV
jgi:predicted phage tail protein